MSNNFSQHRRDYSRGALTKNDLQSNPLEQIKKWVNEAIQAYEYDATAMSLATANELGQPSCRVVLLKEVVAEGLCFFTNYNSHKGRQIAVNPYGALLFFWAAMERQIRIEGVIEKLPEQVSEDYFYSRPIGSQISASVSNQSSVISSLDEIYEKFEKLEAQSKEHKLVKPKHWGGYLLKPTLIEFWQGGENRIHHRFQFTLENDSWVVNQLAP